MPDTDLKNMSDEKLYRISKGIESGYNGMQSEEAHMILFRRKELERKKMQDDIQKLTKPHWTLVPIFWLTFAAFLVALIPYSQQLKDAVLGFFHSSASAPIQTSSPNSPTTQIQSAPISQPTTSQEMKKSSSVTMQSDKTSQ